MGQEHWDVVWERSRAGRHTVVIGPNKPSPAPNDLQVLHVRCPAPDALGGVLEVALRRVAQSLGEAQLVPQSGPAPFAQGLRQRFLGDLPGPSLEAQFVEACNRLATRTEGRTVLAFEALDAADEATVDALTQILKHPDWLRLPLLLTVRQKPQGRVAEIVYLLYNADGEAAVIEIEDKAAPGEPAAPCPWTTLPAEVLRVLRAGAVLGTTFEAALVARLLEEPVARVLEKLQEAVDAGVPLEDWGEGQFSVSPEAITALHNSTLPSLLTFWHARLGELLSGALPVGASTRNGAQTAPAGAVTPSNAEAVRRPRPPTQPVQTARSTPVPEAGALPAGERQWAESTLPPVSLSGKPTRAAAHLQAAGRTDAAVAQYLAAVRDAATRGETRRAYALAEQALTLLDSLSPSAPRALLRAQLYLEKGRLQWHGALQGSASTLSEALDSLETAKASLPHDAPLELVAQLAAATAGICYDMGDRTALHHALAELQESSQHLANAGDFLLATSLLNDQAAVYMRLGDLARATYLLSQSHERFESYLRQHPDHALVVAELADTEHLLARLPLHVQVPPGREEETYVRGLEHAEMAAETYQRLKQYDKLARVWETMGRLALQQGHLEGAQERLTAACSLQQQCSDVPGLARSTAALAELYMLAGQLGQAVTLLADSITLNVEKGSPIGLAFNRQSLGALVSAATQSHGPDTEQLRGTLAALERRLAQAETVLGRVGLPGEAACATGAPEASA